MTNIYSPVLILLILLCVVIMVPKVGRTQEENEQFQKSLSAVVTKLETELGAGKTQDQKSKIQRGLAQAAKFWRSED
ncbi:MAG TPA: hypothetical protein VLH08_00530, partial [Acidobacteriota bacterium]|nr:hypothetical protein [Acidobacteriota bacterium]